MYLFVILFPSRRVCGLNDDVERRKMCFLSSVCQKSGGRDGMGRDGGDEMR